MSKVLQLIHGIAEMLVKTEVYLLYRYVFLSIALFLIAQYLLAPGLIRQPSPLWHLRCFGKGAGMEGGR